MGEEVAFVLVVALCVFLYARRRWRKRRWRVRIHTVRGTTCVRLCRGPSGSPEMTTIANLRVTDPEYEMKLAEAEGTAYDKCAALNNAEKVNRRRS